MTDIVKLTEDLELVNSYKKLAKDYGLFFEKILVPQPGAEAKEYLVFSLSTIKDDINPVAIINRNKRNPYIFYPENFAVELGSQNPLLIWGKISNYLAYAEFMYEVYEQFETPLPKSIRVDELEQLANFYCKATNPCFDEKTRMDYVKGLREFFENENPKSKFKKEWREFYRSELFDSDKSFVQNFFVFLKRHEPETSLDTLVDSSGELKKVYMPEHCYKEFREIIKQRHPGVKYSVGEKKVVDNGLLIDPVTGAAAVTQYGKTVTKEEYDRIREERFSTEGHACLDGLNISRYEGRDVIYKASDENIIASVGQEVACRWVKCPDLDYLKGNGDLNCIDIPTGHLMNFYAEMMGFGVPFCLDYSANSQPNFETVRIVYNTSNDHIVRNVLIGLTMAEVSMAHISMNNQDIMFDVDPQKVESLIQHARARALGSAGSKELLPEKGQKEESVDFSNM